MHETLHSLTQLPLTVSIIMVGILIIMRGYDLAIGRPHERSIIVTILIGFMIVLFGIKQSYWGMVWAVKSSNLNIGLDAIINQLLVPTVINIAIITIAGSVVALVARPYLGRWSSLAVAAALLWLFSIQILIRG